MQNYKAPNHRNNLGKIKKQSVSWSPLVAQRGKDLVVSLPWLWLLLWCTFDAMDAAKKKKKKKKKKNSAYFKNILKTERK